MTSGLSNKENPMENNGFWIEEAYTNCFDFCRGKDMLKELPVLSGGCYLEDQQVIN
jgi:hypothetical protein